MRGLDPDLIKLDRGCEMWIEPDGIAGTFPKLFAFSCGKKRDCESKANVEVLRI